MSESSLRVIVLPSIVYLYFELDFQQDDLRKAVVYYKSKNLNGLNDFAPFFLIVVFCSNSHRGVFKTGGVY